MYERLRRIVKTMHVKVDSEDVLHDVWLYFFKHPELCPPSFRLVKWRVLDLLRKRPPRTLELLDTDAFVDVDDVIKDVNVNDVIKNAGLNDKEQELLYYRFVLDLSITDISRLLGIDRVRVSITCLSIMSRLRDECSLIGESNERA